MRKTLLTALGAVALLSAGAFAAGATPASPSALGVATSDNGLVQKAAVVCGYYGCARVRPRYYGYYGYGYRPYGWYGRRWYY